MNDMVFQQMEHEVGIVMQQVCLSALSILTIAGRSHQGSGKGGGSQPRFMEEHALDQWTSKDDQRGITREFEKLKHFSFTWTWMFFRYHN
jgi:hypothetical protein